MPLIRRRIEDIAAQRMGEIPVVALLGPRSVGKSTLLGSLAAAAGATIIDLDDPATRAALGDRFAAGVMLHLGKYPSRPNDRILTLPVDRLWT